MVQQHEFLDTEHLVTLLIIVPRQAEQDFLEKYEHLGWGIAAFGGPDWSSNPNSVGQQDCHFGPEFRRDKVTGSPVVPGSARYASIVCAPFVQGLCEVFLFDFLFACAVVAVLQRDHPGRRTVRVRNHHPQGPVHGGLL